MLLVIYIMSLCTTDVLNIKDAATSVCARKIAVFCGSVVYGCVQECLVAFRSVWLRQGVFVGYR